VERPDLKALEAELRQARGEIALGRGYTRPDLGLGFDYEYDERAHTVKGGLILTLPVFSNGQELRAVGEARAERISGELDAGRQVALAETQAAWEAFEFAERAADELATRAVPSLEENETLALRSYEEGEISLGELLLIRRDAFEIQLSSVATSLSAALAEIDLETKAGVLQ
jgi:cobalt-zinc-cadmium efflux system outer membrane protein